ncbi:NAD(P)-binding protein [Neoconidiobolus thromboides FSU 785]|nr:NAD(P)-binding protein [Neoconidiobolus thromboides FSU 785]
MYNSSRVLKASLKLSNINYITKRLNSDVALLNSGKVVLRQGSGGRSTSNNEVVTVLGCTGSLGRYVVNKAARRGAQVVVPYRGEEDNKRHLKVTGDLGQVIPMEIDIRNYDQIIECVKHSDTVINLIGRTWETRNFKFQDVHVKGAEAIARACREVNVSRLVHISALNANPESPSDYYKSKYYGEKAVLNEFPEATIVRPSTMYGPEDYFLNRIGFTKNNHLMVNHGKQKLRPVNVVDVAHAIDIISQEQTEFNGKTFELIGPNQLTYDQILDMASNILKEDIRKINLPKSIFSLISKAMSIYPYRVLRPEEIELMLIDDKVHKETLKFQDLGIHPQALEHCILTVMRAYRSPMFYELGYDQEPKVKSMPSSSSN